MSWVVKTRSDGEYMTTPSSWLEWTKSRGDAYRFASKADARRAADGVLEKYEPVVVRLVPKRKPEPMPSMRLRDLIAYRERMERESIAAWFERTFTNGILGTDTARRIRAGEHHR